MENNFYLLPFRLNSIAAEIFAQAERDQAAGHDNGLHIILFG
jgi:hypothetical protein